MTFNETAKRLAVVMATENLCSEKPLRKISIAEICQQANISKSSFYRLFHDKYDIAFWAQSIVSDFGIRNVGRTVNVAQGITITLKGLETFRHLYIEASHSSELVSIDELGRRAFCNLLRETVQNIHRQKIDEELDFMIRGFTVMTREFLKGWLSGYGAGVSIERGAEIFAQCCPQRLRVILDNPTEPSKSESIDFQQYVLASVL